MTRFLVLGLLIIVIISGGLFYMFLDKTQKQSTANLDQTPSKVEIEQLPVPSFTPISTPSATPSSKSVEARLAALEASVAKLQQDQTTTTKTTTPATSYIPLGFGGAASSLDWSTIDTYSLSLNPDNFPGYKSMQLELSLRVYQGNGTAFARLINTNDNSAIAGSDVSTGNQDYTWVSSAGFKLPAGSKVYKIQLKSLTGYEAGIENARIKVNY